MIPMNNEIQVIVYNLAFMVFINVFNVMEDICAKLFIKGKNSTGSLIKRLGLATLLSPLLRRMLPKSNLSV